MSKRISALLFAALVSISSAAHASAKLPKLGADAKQITVSGLSAGAFMAVQLHIAYSSSIAGVGVIAGGPWMCSGGDVFRAQDACMAATDKIDVPALVKQVKRAASSKQIDPLADLAKTRVYIFNSPLDTVVTEPMNAKTVDFYSQLIDPSQIQNQHSIRAAHGMPTLGYGRACRDLGDPYLNNCGFDAAGETLNALYPSRGLVRTAAAKAGLQTFDQKEFGSDAALMNETGWVYVPQSCAAAGAKCPVHVALHGCLQTPDDIKDTFAVHAGYNEWAEGSGLIVLYPQAHSSLMNPKGCFDWWGYTGAEFATKSGAQMRVIKAMMDRLTEF